MRAILTIVAFTLAIGGVSAAWAETRVFIIANNADGYGVDRCLATGAGCGNVVAAAYCHAREFKDAVSFRKVERDEVTGALPAAASTCRGAQCEAFVAIECTR